MASQFDDDTNLNKPDRDGYQLLRRFCVWCSRARYYPATVVPGLLCNNCVNRVPAVEYVKALLGDIERRCAEAMPKVSPAVESAARAALLYLSGLSLQDQPADVQRAGLAVVRQLMKAVGAPDKPLDADPPVTPDPLPADSGLK